MRFDSTRWGLPLAAGAVGLALAWLTYGLWGVLAVSVIFGIIGVAVSYRLLDNEARPRPYDRERDG